MVLGSRTQNRCGVLVLGVDGGEGDYDRSKNDKSKSDYEDGKDRDVSKQTKVLFDNKDERNAEDGLGRASAPASDLENRILKMKEERLKKKSEGTSEVLSWVNKSRKLEEEKNAEKEKALQLSKIFEEQDNIVLGESEDEEEGQHNRIPCFCINNNNSNNSSPNNNFFIFRGSPLRLLPPKLIFYISKESCNCNITSNNNS